MFGKQKVAAVSAEFLGSAILTLAMIAVLRGVGLQLFAGMAGGATMAMMILLAGRISGGHINPIITIGLWTMRKIETIQAIVYVAAQMLGGFAAWRLTEYLVDRNIPNVAGDEFRWQVLIAEAIGAFVFTLGVAAAVERADSEARLATVVGLSLVVGITVASVASTALLNPAVALGVNSWNWAYALGPVVGGVIGMNTYNLLFLASSSGSKAKKSKAKSKKR